MTALFLGLFLVGGATAAAQELIWPGERLATIEGEHLRAYVPDAHRDELRELIARADQILETMLADADFTPPDKLRLLISNWKDAHNGFSTVVPFSLVQVELAPSLAASNIFSGFRETERTLVHEFAHHISNDRNHGFRGVLESIFGRVLPNDLLSLLVAYFSTPAHITMPFFWHEGLASWAETAYADPGSPWAGRGRDPLVHMVWRLDALEQKIPRVDEWRITFHEWPFGDRAYNYGLAYTRFLEGAYRDRASIWRIIDDQARRWPFFFNGGTGRVLGKSHTYLIQEARRALQEEQDRALAVLRAQPVTEFQRLTPEDMEVAAPAWTAEGGLVFAAKSSLGRARLHRLAADGTLTAGSETTRALAGVRGDASGWLTYHEFNYRVISKLHLGDLELGERLLQPDRYLEGERARVAAIRLTGGGQQELVLCSVDLGREQLVGEPLRIPTTGTPFSPAFRRTPWGPELLWVETGYEGSWLMAAPLADLESTRPLHQVRGRILHPICSSDGSELFFCSDVSGVANAYHARFTADGALADVLPITHTLGGVIACVPSEDGQRLALVDHDRRGPFLAIVPRDQLLPRSDLPVLRPVWPAPRPEWLPAASSPPGTRESGAGSEDETRAPSPWSLPKREPVSDPEYTPEDYSGLRELRPWFWTPTTFPAPGGGFGVVGLATDPLFTHLATAGIGVGPVESELVASAGYAYLGSPLQFRVFGWRSELTYNDMVMAQNRAEFDYTETVQAGQLSVGRGVAGLEQTFLGYLTAGLEDHQEVRQSSREFDGQTLVSTPIFDGAERYLEVTLGYDNATFFPTSYAPEDGLAATATYRFSGFGGDLVRNMAFANASYVWSFLPEYGQQLVGGGQVGWSSGDRTLQGDFAIGGSTGRGLPRGYLETEALGEYFLASSVAYRTPIFRKFEGISTTPFRHRQVAVELFYDSAHVSTDRYFGDGEWFSSVGAELHSGWEVASILIHPGLGLAYQLDGDREASVYFTLGFRY